MSYNDLRVKYSNGHVEVFQDDMSIKFNFNRKFTTALSTKQEWNNGAYNMYNLKDQVIKCFMDNPRPEN